MTATDDTSRRPNIPHDASENTLWEAEQREDSPLLFESTTSTESEEEDVDATTIYAQILEEHLPWYKRPSAIWLFPLYGIAATSGGMLTVPLSQFEITLLCKEYMNRYPPSNSTIMATAAGAATQLTAGLLSTMAHSPSSMLIGEMNAFSPPKECQVHEIQAFTAKALAVMQVLGGICGTLSIGYWSSLSDKHGRVKLMMVGCVGNLITLCCLAIMGNWWDQVGFPLLYIMAIVSGLLGGISLNATMSMAYAADCTATSKRSLIYSRLHACLFVGLMVGPPIGSVLAEAKGFMTLLQICFVSTLISGGFLIFLLPESLPSKQSPHIRQLYEEAIGPKAMQAAASSKRSQETVAWHSHVVRSLRFFKPNGHNTNFIILAAISFLQTLAIKGTFAVLILYTNKAFNWTEIEGGVLYFLGSAVRLISLLILSPILVHSFHKWNNKKQQALAAKSQAHKGPNKKDDFFNASSSSSTHPWAAERQDRNDSYTNSDIIRDHPDRILVGMDDPAVASSIEHLGEAALNLSDDEESFQERRRRKSSATLLNTASLNYSSTASSSFSSAAAAPRKGSVGIDSSQIGQRQAEQQKKLEKARDDLKLDTWIIRGGFMINSTTYIGYGLATETWIFYVWAALHAISIITAPSLKSLITSQVEPSQFGAVLGAVQVLESMSGILSPVVISWVYALTVETMPEFVWYTCAALTGTCVVLTFMIRQRELGRRALNV